MDIRALRRIGTAVVWLVVAGGAIVACNAATSTAQPGSSGTPVSTSIGNGQTAVPGDGQTAGPVDPGSNPCLGADVEGTIEARATIDRTDLAEQATIEAVEAIRFEDAGVAAATQALKGGVTGDALWAATWIYASSGCDIGVLVPLLAHDNATIRIMAAAALLAGGRSEATPVLAALLTDAGHLEGSKPPISIADFAAGRLSAYVDGPTIQEGAEPAATVVAWTEWLATHGGSMVFNAETRRWSAP